MTTTDRSLLEKIASDVQAIRERLPVIEHRVGDHRGRIDSLEIRVRALEEKVTRLTVIAGVAGGIAGAVLSWVIKAVSQ